jgi:hypothetical protein
MTEKWTIDSTAETSVEVLATVGADSDLKKNWPSFERDVADNPFYHPKPGRIAKLEGTHFPAGTHRYKKNVLRVVYLPDKPSKKVFPLEAARAVDVSYKKRSSRRAKVKKPEPKRPKRP